MDISNSTVRRTAEPALPFALTLDAAVAYSGMSKTRIEGLLRNGDVSAVRTGRRTLVLGDSLRSFLIGLPSAR